MSWQDSDSKYGHEQNIEFRRIPPLSVAAGYRKTLLTRPGALANVCLEEVSAGPLAVPVPKSDRGPDPGRDGGAVTSNTGYCGQVGASHRMISTYLNSLTSHSLILDRAAESPPGPGMDWRRPAGAVPRAVLLRRSLPSVSCG